MTCISTPLAFSCSSSVVPTSGHLIFSPTKKGLVLCNCIFVFFFLVNSLRGYIMERSCYLFKDLTHSLEDCIEHFHSQTFFSNFNLKCPYFKRAESIGTSCKIIPIHKSSKHIDVPTPSSIEIGSLQDVLHR